MKEINPDDYQKTWNTIAKSFDKTRKKPWQQCLNFIQKLQKNITIADIGCGNGRHLIPAAKHTKHAIGIDISDELLKIIKEKIQKENIQNIKLIHSDARKIPLKDNAVDAVLYIAALHNIKGRENRIQSLREIRRILKKDGTAQISVWSRWQDKYRKNFFKKWFTHKKEYEFGDINIYWRQHGLDIPRFYHLYSKKEFIQDIKEADLEIVDIQDVKLYSKKHPDNYFAIITRQ